MKYAITIQAISLHMHLLKHTQTDSGAWEEIMYKNLKNLHIRI